VNGEIHPGDHVRIGAGREAEILAWGQGSVLRLMRDPNGTESLKHQVAAMTAAKASGCPVPWAREPIWFEGRPGVVMERVDGPDLLNSVTRRPWSMVSCARILAHVHSELHEVRAPLSLPATREVIRGRIEAAAGIPKHLSAFALDLLGTLPDGGSLCHGDFHPGNVLLGRAGPFVIDWTGASRGDPDGDVARTLFLLRSGEPLPGTPAPMRLVIAVGRRAFAELYRRNYIRRRPINHNSIERWLVPHAAARIAEGIEKETEALIRWLEARYAQR
jgi:thiamine kinase